MKKDIFVIIGQTGEYSDRSEWTVCYVDTEDEAKRYVELATAKAKEIEVLGDGDRWDAMEKYGNPYDENMQMDYTGTYYSYSAVKHVEEVKEMDLVIKTVAN